MFIHDPDLVPFNVLPNFNIFKRYDHMSGIKKEALPLLLGQFSKFTSVYQHLVRPY